VLKLKVVIFSVAVLLRFRAICKLFRRRRGKSRYVLP